HPTPTHDVFALDADAPPRERFVGRARILVVDDEPIIGRVVSRVFADRHDVRSTVSVDEALACLCEPDARFDLILCDMHMARRNGMDLHAELARKAPDLASRLAFMIGGAVSPTTRDFLARIPNARIEKPFDAEELRAMVHRALATLG